MREGCDNDIVLVSLDTNKRRWVGEWSGVITIKSSQESVEATLIATPFSYQHCLRRDRDGR